MLVFLTFRHSLRSLHPLPHPTPECKVRVHLEVGKITDEWRAESWIPGYLWSGGSDSYHREVGLSAYRELLPGGRNITYRIPSSLLLLAAAPRARQPPSVELVVAQAIRRCFRFIDDLGAIGNPFLSRLLYLDDSIPGTVTPIHMRLTFQVRAPPIGLVPRFPLPPAPHIKAGLYDKRDGPLFVVLRLSCFIPLSSNVDPACRQNILIGQAARLAVLCSEWWEFAQNMAAITLILVSRGYIVDDCFQRLTR